MPSQPDPDSPFLASRLQATLGVRAPGTPTTSGQPGVQAGSVSYPAPPAPASGPVGRPANPQPAAPMQPAQPKPMERQGEGQRVDMGGQQPPGQPGTTNGAAPGQQPAAGPAPLGYPEPDGSTRLTPEGDMRFRQAVMAGRDRLGPIPKSFRHPTLPEIPFELGKHNWNPFTSTWSTPGEEQ